MIVDIREFKLIYFIEYRIKISGHVKKKEEKKIDKCLLIRKLKIYV